MLISTGGVLIRTAVSQIREMGRSTQGVTLIALGEGEKLAGLERIEERDLGSNGNGATAATDEHAEDDAAGRGAPSRQRLLRPRCTDVAHLQFQRGAGDAARGSAFPRRRRNARLARQRHVGDGDEPPRQGIHRHRRRGRERPARAARDPANYKVLFLQGGATLQFAQVPMNLLRGKGKADYVSPASGRRRRSRKRRRYCDVHVAASSEDKNFTYAPKQWNVRKDAAYVHYLLQRDHRRRRVPRGARHRRRAARGRRVLAFPVARRSTSPNSA